MLSNSEAFAPRVAADREAASQARRAAVQAAVAGATRRVAPLWPLRHFVAVNPFLGLADQPFEDAARYMARVAGATMTAPRSFFAEALRAGRIVDADLAAALAERGAQDRGPTTIDDLREFAFADEAAPTAPLAPTVAAVARASNGTDWERLCTNSISNWAASYFDAGQALWTSPWRDEAPYAAWRAEAAFDRTPEIAGIRGFRACVARFGASPREAILQALDRLGIPEAGLEAYLHRLLMSIGGWAAYARYHVWESELYGKDDDSRVEELLAIRLVWEVALLDAFASDGLDALWSARRRELAEPVRDEATEAELAGRLTLQRAFEHALQRALIDKLDGSAPGVGTSARKRVQAAFCIDVRSEIYRRALESVAGDVETIGFAGFFGFPIEYVRLGDSHGGAQCPVLLTPQFTIREGLSDADGNELASIGSWRQAQRRVAAVWRSFKFAAVACFGFVGPVGLIYLKKILSDSFGASRPVETPSGFGLSEDIAARLAPVIEVQEIDGRATGMTTAQRIEVAAGVLRAMSLTDGFARIVLLAGHGSTTVNNPHATGLDCGACGGHTGEANARVAAAVLQDPQVRAGLLERGIAIPEDTVFIGGQHDTTTDEVTIFDESSVPPSHAADLAQFKADLAAAARIARAERARSMRLDPGFDVDAAVVARSRDWSQVRPEWGLAGCYTFVAAPRHRTSGCDLGGRSFLHSYEWQRDADFGVLELIMTAPMVVASWISLQYYGSTVDNRVFGSGNKVLHNVVGTIGIFEGNGGDLRVGLPWQSVHDGERYVHEPARLNVIIEAPIEAMNSVLARHESVRQLLDNGWLNLFALDENGKVSHRYVGDLEWRRASSDGTEESVHDAHEALDALAALPA